MNVEEQNALDELKNTIFESLNSKYKNVLNEAFGNQDSIEKAALAAVAQQQHQQAMKRNRRVNGRVAIVNRVRNNHIQMQKKESDTKGYKIVNGEAVKMSFKEMKKRKVAARIAARKRKNEMAVIDRKRAISMKLRAQRLG